jgi:hypothetical protein
LQDYNDINDYRGYVFFNFFSKWNKVLLLKIYIYEEEGIENGVFILKGGRKGAN